MMSAMRGLFGLFFMSVVVVAAGCRSERYPAVVSGLEPLTESEVGSTEGEASPVAPEDLTVLDRRVIMIEVDVAFSRIVAGAARYYDTARLAADGAPLSPRFPDSVGRTPSAVPCGEEPTTPETWGDPTWTALRFSMLYPHYYSYQFDSAGTGLDATHDIYAFGDLDCDGVLSTFIEHVAFDEGQWRSQTETIDPYE